ncbi:MAG: hypothetical protein ABI743_13090 [bacterium]
MPWSLGEPDPASLTDPAGDAAMRRYTEPATQDLLLVDFTQGLAIGGAFYLAALTISQSLAPPHLIILIAFSLIGFGYSTWRLRWRDGALMLGATIGLAANLLVATLLFLLYSVAWSRQRRAMTTPWICVALALFSLGAALCGPTIESQLEVLHREVLMRYYLMPLSVASLGCALSSQFAVATRRSESMEVSLAYLGAQWLTIIAMVLSVLAIALMVVRPMA